MADSIHFFAAANFRERERERDVEIEINIF